MKSNDRRSSSTESTEPAEPSAYKEEQERLERAAGIRRHADGSIKRIAGSGFRSLPDFFDPAKCDIPMTRGDFTNILALLYHNEEQTSWWVRVKRALSGRRQVGSVRKELLATHKRALTAMAAEVQKRLEAVAEDKIAKVAK